MKHHLHIIGMVSMKRAYLDIDREEAIRRFCEAEGVGDVDANEIDVQTIHFDDELMVYDAWET